MPELFQQFEINPSPWWERVWRIIAGSVVVHILLVACVLYIPGLREAFNIANAFAGAKYVDKDYNKTIIGERAVLISATEKFEYPPGYFQNPEAMPSPEQPLAPQIVETAKAEPLPPPMPRPKKLPKLVPEPDPSPSPVASPQPSPAEQVAGLREGMTKEEQNKKLDEIANKNDLERFNEDEINKKALTDWLAKAKAAKDNKEIDLTGQIEMIIEADRAADGKLLNAEVVSKKGDPKLQELVKEFVAALSDSHALARLKDIKHIRLEVVMNDTQVTVKVSSEVESPERAAKMADGYNAMLFVGKMSKKGQTEETIYKNTKISADGKQVVVNFTMPRKDVTEILTKLSTS